LVSTVETPGWLFGPKSSDVLAKHLEYESADITIPDIVDPLDEAMLVVLKCWGAWTFCGLGIEELDQAIGHRQA
jgi:hypothetical protein